MGPASNVRPGMVVDKEICHPHEFDYYLNSHAGMQDHMLSCSKASVGWFIQLSKTLGDWYMVCYYNSIGGHAVSL